jgi:isochorismate hydrolase
MQEKLFPAVAEKETLAANVVRLARFSRIVGIPVIITEQEKLGSTLPEIRDELREIAPILKTDFNCFGSALFIEKVKATKRKTLILTGTEAHICVAQTALSGVSEYSVHVVSDAISSRSLRNREIALTRMMQAGVTVTSTEMVIYEIMKKAGTDVFREVLKLVK